MRAAGKVMLEQLGVPAAAAGGKLGALIERAGRVDALEQELETLKSEGIRRDLRSALSAGLDSKRISLGALQKSIASFALRGDSKSAWSAAMGKLESTTRDSVLDAACSVAITADDLSSVRAYIDASGPSVAPIAGEPPRDAVAEADEMDAQVAKIAKIAEKTREHYSRQTAANSKK